VTSPLLLGGDGLDSIFDVGSSKGQGVRTNHGQRLGQHCARAAVFKDKPQPVAIMPGATGVAPVHIGMRSPQAGAATPISESVPMAVAN
jgi:hypothetical protein